MNSLERLNYVPGQRLTAEDLKLEADYFITVRRLINQGLFAPGVLNGLEVVKSSSREVMVKPGLAFDPQGREMYLPSAVTMTIPAAPPMTALGYYVVIRYNEVLVSSQANGCSTSTGVPADTRIDEQCLLEVTKIWPNPALCAGTSACSPASLDCAIVLAMVTLDPFCNVGEIVTGVRQYAYPRNVTHVQAVAFTGEKDIDSNNSKKLYFHCRGGTPNSVWLYLRGDRLSTLHYTELGAHVHTVGVTGTTDVETAPISIEHNHPTGEVATGSSETQPGSKTKHHHSLYAYVHDYIGAPHVLAIDNKTQGATWDDGDPITWVQDVTVDHAHLVPSHPTDKSSLKTTAQHKHGVSAPGGTDRTGATDPTGGTASDARKGPMLGYLKDMTVCLDGTLDLTPLLLSQISDPAWKNQLGDGTATHPINMVGTGGIDLYRLTGVTPSDGEHCLEFTVGPGDGGKVMWELYIE